MKKHDESKDLKSIGKVAFINYASKCITVSKQNPLGIRRLGMLDYLTHYCGWRAYYTGDAVKATIKTSVEVTKHKNVKKEEKQHALTNKKKR